MSFLLVLQLLPHASSHQVALLGPFMGNAELCASVDASKMQCCREGLFAAAAAGQVAV